MEENAKGNRAKLKRSEETITRQTARVQMVAAILWANGDDSWDGRKPDWSEIVANQEFFEYRITTEEQAKTILFMTAADWEQIVQLRSQEDAAHVKERLIRPRGEV